MSSLFRWGEVTAIFGGTFDPPHLGHRTAVLGLFKQPGIRQVLVIPSGASPFKPLASSSEHRLKMTELTFAKLPGVQVDSREIERAKVGETTGFAPSYTIDTLIELRREIPLLAFVVGADQLTQLPSWHRFRDLIGICHWIILARKPDGDEVAQRALSSWDASGLIRKDGGDWLTPTETRLTLVGTEANALASRTIREEIARQSDRKALLDSLQNWVTPEVRAYLMEHRIYGMNGA